MTEKKYPLSVRKQILFWFLLVSIVVMIPFLVATGYLGYKKLNFSFEFGERFGVFDDELGWTLKKNASSYIRGRSLLTGEMFFDSSVYTDALGFRSQNPGVEHTPEGIVAIGDSWTFGYCVNFEETYPYFLEKLSNIPVTNLGALQDIPTIEEFLSSLGVEDTLENRKIYAESYVEAMGGY